MNEEKKNSTDNPLCIDESMLPIADFVSELSAFQGELVHDDVFSMNLEKVRVGMPVQLEIQTDDEDNVVLGGSPPLYYVETTFMPVFHQLELTIEIERKLI